MKLPILPTMAICASTLLACSQQQTVTNDNPLTAVPTAKFSIPAYDQITISNYRDAINAGIETHKANIDAIVRNTAAPTFDNTIAAFDRAGRDLESAALIFSTLSESNSTEAIREFETEVYPLLASHSDDVYMNADLFRRVKAVYDAMMAGLTEGACTLTHEQQSAVRHIYRDFEKAGAALSPENQERLRALNLRLSELQLQFSQNLLHETNNTFVTITTRDSLAGLPEANIEAAAQMAREQGKEGQYMFNMQRPSCNPVLQYCSNREVRRRVYDAYYNRGNQDNAYNNKDICRQLVELRLERARLFGEKNAAEGILKDRMAKNETAVYNLLNSVWAPAVAKANEELDDIRIEMQKDGLDCEPEGWDYMYYSSRAKAAKFNIDEEEIAQYFELNNVLQGIFYTAGKLYGVSFKEITADVPAYEKTAQAWEVLDRDGSTVGIFYSDYFPRDGKGAGAWMTELRKQSYVTGPDGKEVREIPVIVNVCNMTKGAEGKPALQNLDNVETMFHEFGHALHFMLHDVHYDAVYNVETDFVELPSQINEHWATDPAVLSVYAKHYKTGEIIPDSLVAKMDAAGKYGQGFATVEYLAAALVDMDLHTLTEVPEGLDVMAFEQQKLAERGIPRQIYPRYRVTNFSHCMGGGYTAGYYCYLWSEVLDCDGFEAFKETGDVFNPEVAERFRKYCLMPGGIDDGMTMYKAFRGHEPEIGALLRKRGLDK